MRYAQDTAICLMNQACMLTINLRHQVFRIVRISIHLTFIKVKFLNKWSTYGPKIIVQAKNLADASIEVVNRRQFLRGDIRGTRLPRRPPWSVAESDFIASCTRCDACIEACKEANILYRGSGGYPEISFAQTGCTFCGDCLQSCETGALLAAHPAPSLAWDLRAQIKPNCLSSNGIVCRACGDACDTRAIQFQLQTGGRATPAIDQTLCNGCGECFAVCPVHAVEISSIQINKTKPGEIEEEHESM